MRLLGFGALVPFVILLTQGCAPKRQSEQAPSDPSRAQCIVTTNQVGNTYTANVQGNRSVIEIGFNEVEAELQGDTVMRIQGMASEPVGTVTNSGATVRHQFVDGALTPPSGGHTSINEENFQLEFSSSGCSDRELMLGAVQLSVHLIRKANGGS